MTPGRKKPKGPEFEPMGHIEFKFPAALHNEIIDHEKSGHNLTDYKPEHIREAAHKAMMADGNNINLYHNLLDKARDMKIKEFEEKIDTLPYKSRDGARKTFEEMLNDTYPKAKRDLNYIG